MQAAKTRFALVAGLCAFALSLGLLGSAALAQDASEGKEAGRSLLSVERHWELAYSSRG